MKDNTLENMRKLKIALNIKAKLPTATEDDVTKAKEAIRAHSHFVKLSKEREKLSLQKQQDKAYTKKLLENSQKHNKWHLWREQVLPHIW